MTPLKLLLILALVALCASTYTHGIAGNFQAVGKIRWEKWGYWSKSHKRWTPLREPNFGGFTPNAYQIVGTSDGGAIVVGDFASVNGRSAANVAYYDPELDDWFPANEVGLYNVRTNGGTACLSAQGTGAGYISRNGNAATTPYFVWSTTTTTGTPDAISVPVKVNPNDGTSRVLQTNDPVTQFASAYHSLGKGRAILADSTTPNEFYVFGNFYNVGLDVNAPHNRDFTAAGIVKFTYDPTTKKITPSTVGTNGYKARKVQDPQNMLHPRHCGHAGSAKCTADPMMDACGSSTPHTQDGDVVAGFTKEGANFHFFVQEPNRDVFRWSSNTDRWVNIVVNDGSAARDGTGQDLGPTMGVAQQFNFRVSPAGPTPTTGQSNAGSPGDFKWMVSEDQTNVWLWRDLVPFTAAFGSTDFDQGGVQGATVWTWDDGTGGTKAYYGGARSTGPAGKTFVSAYTGGSTENLNNDLFRNLDVSLPDRPQRRITGLVTPASVALGTASSLVLVDERYPGSGQTTFQSNRYAHSRFVGIRRVAGATSPAATLDGTPGQPRFAVGNRGNNPGNDANGNPQFAWDFEISGPKISGMWHTSGNDIYVQAQEDIYYDPILETAHNVPLSRRRFRKTFGGSWMVYTNEGAWERPFGGGISTAPAKFWDATIGTEKRVYMLTNNNGDVYNFPAQSGVAVYDDAKREWHDPLGDWRLISLTNNRYDTGGSTVWADVGQPGVANIVHFQGSDVIIAGSFSWVGDTHYPSILVWDRKTVGAGFSHVGSVNTGLYTNLVGGVGGVNGKRWNEDIVPSTDNRKVGQGNINVLTNNGNRLFVAGNFDRSSNSLESGNWLKNVATIANYKDATATWVSVDGGCEGGDVRAMVVFNGELYAGGGFDRCGGPQGGPKQYIARINADVAKSRRWRSLGVGVDGGDVAALVVWGDVLMVGGEFSSAGASGTQITSKIAIWTGSTWKALPGACNDVCENNVMGLVPTTVGNGNFLGARIAQDINSMVATDRLWAVIDGAEQNGQGGNSVARELVYFNGAGWFRPTIGGITADGGDTYNGFLAVNGSDGTVMVANGNLPQNGNVNAPDMIIVRPAATGQLHTIEVNPGFQGTDGAITHFAGASSMTVSLVLVALALVMLF